MMETVMVMMIMSIAGLALSGFSTMISKTESNNKRSYGILQFRSQMIQNLTDTQAWNNTVKAALNGQNDSLLCLAEKTDCSTLAAHDAITSFKVFNSNNQLFYNPDAGSGTGGFNQKGEVCDGFSLTTPNVNCPFRYQMSWTPLCPSSGSCVSPGILIRAKLISSSVDKSLSVNGSLYDIQIFGSIPAQQNMKSFGDIYYTNIGTPIDIKVLANDVGEGSMTVKSVTNSAHGGVVTINPDQTVRYSPSFTPAPGFFGTDTFTYIAEDSAGWTSSATVKIKVMTPYTWTGNAGDGKWSTPGNWCGSIPTSGGVIVAGEACPGQSSSSPQANSWVVFDDTCDAGDNCNARIDENTSFQGLYMAAGYLGTVTQGLGKSVSINAAGGIGSIRDQYSYIQNGGNFVGSNQDITVGGDFKLGGGRFTSTAKKLILKGQDFNISGSSIFMHNNGIVEFQGNSIDQSLQVGSTEFYDLQFTANAGSINFNAGDINVARNLLLANKFKPTYSNLVAGNIKVKGDLSCQVSGYAGDARIILVGTDEQKIDGSDFDWASSSTANWKRCAFPSLEIRKPSGDVKLLGTVHLTGDYLWYSGNVVVGSADLRFGHGATRVYYVPGPFTYNNVTYYNIGGLEELRDRYAPQNPATFNVGGNLWLNNHAGNSCGDGYSGCSSSYGQINAYGDVTAESSGMGPGFSTETVINIVGNRSQVIKQVNPFVSSAYPGSPEPNYIPNGGGANLPTLVINKTGGNVKLDGPIKISKSFIVAATNAGTVDTSNTDLILRGPVTLTPGDFTYQTVYMDNRNTTTTLNGVLKVSRNLHMTNGYQSGNYGYAVLNGGSIEVQGDVRYTDFGYNGTTIIKMLGGGRKFESVSGSARLLPMSIDTSGGLPINLTGGPFYFTGDFINKSSIDATAATAYFHSATIEPNNAVFNTVGICDIVNSKALNSFSPCSASNLVGSPLKVSNELRVVKSTFNLNGQGVQGAGVVRVNSTATLNLGGTPLSNTGGVINNGVINP